MTFEYKVVPAPTRGLKAKGIKAPSDRFANALETEINVLAADGWEYVRADTLPSEEREGLLSKTTVYQNMLVFRREVVVSQPAQEPVYTAPSITERPPSLRPEPPAPEPRIVEEYEPEVVAVIERQEPRLTNDP